MAVEKINIQNDKPRILIAPLDWGLGHATRIIPIVKILEEAGATVVLAADGAIGRLLQNELPHREILKLSGYNIRYGKSSKTFFFKLLLQVPSIIKCIKNENNWLKSTIAEKRIDAVISDNRFGLYSKKVPSAYITHQLFIETGYSNFINTIAQKIHYKFIKNFSECWVPDFEKNGLAGKLSHPETMPDISVKNIGPLTRLQEEDKIEADNSLLIILSGPEPQRTIWENALLKQLETYHQNAVLVRGLPLVNKSEIKQTATLKIHNYLSSKELAKEIKKASLIICRSGYSTIMDLVALEKKAIIVPTPGQGEQKYLGKYLMEQQRFFSCTQDAFQLQNVLQKVQNFPFKIQPIEFRSINKRVVLDWLEKIQNAMAYK